MHTDLYRHRSGGGFLSLFGLPFLAAGVFMMLSPFVVSLQTASGDQPPAAALVAFGTPFALVGVGLVFGRSGVEVDGSRREARTWYGLLVPLWSSTRKLDDFDRVTLRLARTTGKNAHDYYPICLEGAEPFSVASFQGYQEARREAELVARAAGRDLFDSTSGTEVRREHAYLDEDLAHRIKRQGETVELVTAPAGCRIRLESSGREGTFELPPSGLLLLDYFGLLGAAFVPAAMLVFFGIPLFLVGSGTDAPPTIVLGVFGGLIALVALGAAYSAMRILTGAFATSTVAVSRRGLEHRRRTFLGTTVETLDGPRIEEIMVRAGHAAAALNAGRANGRGPQAPEWVRSAAVSLVGGIEGVSVISDDRTIVVGRGLRPQDLEWLRSAIVHFLVGEY